MSSEDVKKWIIDKYDSEADALNTDEWMRKGESARVPESKASHYFIDRKVSTALELCRETCSETSNALEIGCSFGHMTSLLARYFSLLTAGAGIGYITAYLPSRDCIFF